jgi:hypothetical protein
MATAEDEDLATVADRTTQQLRQRIVSHDGMMYVCAAVFSHDYSLNGFSLTQVSRWRRCADHLGVPQRESPVAICALTLWAKSTDWILALTLSHANTHCSVRPWSRRSAQQCV